MTQHQALQIAREWREAAKKAREETPPRTEYAEILDKWADNIEESVKTGIGWKL